MTVAKIVKIDMSRLHNGTHYQVICFYRGLPVTNYIERGGTAEYEVFNVLNPQ
jgi:hypothetical protein